MGFWLCENSSHGQSLQSEDYGAMIGVTITFGSALNRLGLTAGGYRADGRLQLNVNARWYYNFRSLGPDLAGPEATISLGGLYAWGGHQKRKMNL